MLKVIHKGVSSETTSFTPRRNKLRARDERLAGQRPPCAAGRLTFLDFFVNKYTASCSVKLQDFIKRQKQLLMLRSRKPMNLTISHQRNHLIISIRKDIHLVKYLIA